VSKHNTFILRPLSTILEESALVLGHIRGMQKIPLLEYFMQSVFLKMTGAQEQKMKCICWELATEDYEYRYKRYNGRWDLGECSNYEAKNTVYQDLIEQINKQEHSYKGLNPDQKRNIIDSATKTIKEFYKTAGLICGMQRDFQIYENMMKALTIERFSNANNESYILFSNEQLSNTIYDTLTKQKLQYKAESLIKMYEQMYAHRNRCAHNTLSYQEHPLPFNILAKDNNKYENYFIRFAILILIDYIFIENYKKYLDVL